MRTNLIHDRGRGPEIVGTRVTVYNLLPDFLEPELTENDLCRLYELTPEQVAAARAYVLDNCQTVWAKHAEIEARIAIGNPPEVIEAAQKTHAEFLAFREWLAQRENAKASEITVDVTAEHGRNGPGQFPTFREWLAQRESRLTEGL
jgi:uncharacterized protein (DUF433 family)